MDEPNYSLDEELKNIVRNQIKNYDPPETKQTYDRLIKLGFPEDVVIRMLAVMKSHKPFNQERYIKRHHNLPNEPK